MINILLFTDRYPYFPGEEFIHPEVLLLSKKRYVQIIICPQRIGTDIRKLPDNVIICREPAFLWTQKSQLKWIKNAVRNIWFWNELLFHPQILLNYRKIRSLVSVSARSYWFSKKIIEQCFPNKKTINKTVLYSFWLNAGAFSAAKISTRLNIASVICRAHGADVYESRSYNGGYIPYKINAPYAAIHKVYAAAIASKEHLAKRNKSLSLISDTLPLGVSIPEYISKFSLNSNYFHILSCSRVDEIKRVDLILEGLVEFCLRYPQYTVSWTHIGDGSGFSDLKKKCLYVTSPNLSIKLTDYKDNIDVLNFYKDNFIDLFVTTTSSEGGPISIKEALAHGVPVVATNVGGIPDIVHSGNGCLIPVSFNPDSFVEAVLNCKKRANKNFRIKCQKEIKEKYSHEILTEEMFDILIKQSNGSV